MSFVVVERRYFRHSSLCHLDHFRYGILFPFLSENLDSCLGRGKGVSWSCRVHDWDRRKVEFVHLLLSILVGRLAPIVPLRLNSLFVLDIKMFRTTVSMTVIASVSMLLNFPW